MASADKLIWSAQTKGAFVKVYADWMGIGKFHFSFVKHCGPPSYSQASPPIEGSLSFTSEDGAMALSGFVLSGAAAKASEQARANKTGKYFDKIFRHQGGSPARPEKNKTCLYREITLEPSTANPTDFALTARQCEGQTNEKGGFMPIKDAEYQTIIIRLSSNSLYALCKAMDAEYAAYRTAKQMQDQKLLVCCLYDVKGHLYSNMHKVVSLNKAVGELNRSILKLAEMKQAYSPNEAMYYDAISLINSRKCNTSYIHHASTTSDEIDTIVVDIQEIAA